MDQGHFHEGIGLFNRGAFFEAHEVLEDVWRAAPEPERKFLQGVIQVAVALHHHSKGNVAGARSLLARAVRNLSAYPEDFGGIRLARLRVSLDYWQCCLIQGAPVPSPPQIEWQHSKTPSQTE